MKQNPLLIILLFILTTSIMSAQTRAIEYKQKWENAKHYTLAFAEAMPDSLYTFKPTEDEMSYAEQIRHLNQNMLWLHADYIIPANAVLLNKLKENCTSASSKKEIIQVLTSTFDALISIYSTTNDRIFNDEITLFGKTKTKNQVCLLAIDHLSHHRGQCAVYLRLKKITPPKYIGY